jgi:primosomal protein N' (replication factor Y)
MLMPRVELVDLRRIGPGPRGTGGSACRFTARSSAPSSARSRRSCSSTAGLRADLVCDACGALVGCPKCSVALTLHRSRGVRLLCHTAATSARPLRVCVRCRSDKPRSRGRGPSASRRRSPPPSRRRAWGGSTATRRVGSERARLDRMRAGAIESWSAPDGDQGPDLPRVTLVGVLSPTRPWGCRTSGRRSGPSSSWCRSRGAPAAGTRRGTVMIQTRNPGHAAIALARA